MSIETFLGMYGAYAEFKALIADRINVIGIDRFKQAGIPIWRRDSLFSSDIDEMLISTDERTIILYYRDDDRDQSMRILPVELFTTSEDDAHMLMDALIEKHEEASKQSEAELRRQTMASFHALAAKLGIDISTLKLD